MTRPQALIVRILREFRNPIHRTKLIKLAYLIDYAYYRNFGRPISGLRYMWDNYGPNAISNAIVSEAHLLVNDRVVHMTQGQSQYGGPNYRYALLDRDITADFSPAEEYVIQQVLNEYKGMTMAQLVAASKKTKPFQEAQQYDVLRMKKDTPAERGADTAEYEEALSARGTKTLRELKRKYNLR